MVVLRNRNIQLNCEKKDFYFTDHDNVETHNTNEE